MTWVASPWVVYGAVAAIFGTLALVLAVALLVGRESLERRRWW